MSSPVDEIKVMLESELSPVDIKVWVYVRHFASERARRSRSLLAKRLKMEPDNLSASAKRLVALGLMKTPRVTTGHAGPFLTFQAVLPEPASPAAKLLSLRQLRQVTRQRDDSQDTCSPLSKNTINITTEDSPKQKPSSPARERARDKLKRLDPRQPWGGNKALLTECYGSTDRYVRNKVLQFVTDTLIRVYNRHRQRAHMKPIKAASQRQYFARLSSFIIENDVDLDEYITWANTKTKFMKVRFVTPSVLSGPWLQGEWESREHKPMTLAGAKPLPPPTDVRNQLVAAGFKRMRTVSEAIIRHIDQFTNDMLEQPNWFPEADPDYEGEIMYLVEQRRGNRS